MCECVSTLCKYGADVKVIMSDGALQFIQPLSFEALSHHKVLTESKQVWADKDGENANHIAYAKWADIVLIAPASANTIAKIASGIADSILLSTILASQSPKLLAPAMNTAMLHAPQTQRNLACLQDMGYTIIPPRVSTLVCGDEGDGALADNDEIIFALTKALTVKSTFWEHRAVIITGGGSKEAIDDVRYISNHSSGKQASALALALFEKGANITFISSAFPYPLPKAIKCIKVHNIESYEKAIESALNACANDAKKPFVFMAAALADYAPNKQEGKIKKEQNGEILQLICHKTKDILACISADKAYKIGFKAELDSQNALIFAQDMLEKKQCEMVCLNIIDSQNPFGGDDNIIHLITRKQGRQILKGSKWQVAREIATYLETLLS